MILSVIVCVKNEEPTLKKVIDRVLNVDLGRDWTKDIIIVDNLSTDGTHEILKELGKKHEITIIYNKVDIEKWLGMWFELKTKVHPILININYRSELQSHTFYWQFFDLMLKQALDENSHIICLGDLNIFFYGKSTDNNK